MNEPLFTPFRPPPTFSDADTPAAARVARRGRRLAYPTLNREAAALLLFFLPIATYSSAHPLHSNAAAG
jgi:hypothetical protein